MDPRQLISGPPASPGLRSAKKQAERAARRQQYQAALPPQLPWQESDAPFHLSQMSKDNDRLMKIAMGLGLICSAMVIIVAVVNLLSPSLALFCALPLALAIPGSWLTLNKYQRGSLKERLLNLRFYEDVPEVRKGLIASAREDVENWSKQRSSLFVFGFVGFCVALAAFSIAISAWPTLVVAVACPNFTLLTQRLSYIKANQAQRVIEADQALGEARS